MDDLIVEMRFVDTGVDQGSLKLQYRSKTVGAGDTNSGGNAIISAEYSEWIDVEIETET